MPPKINSKLSTTGAVKKLNINEVVFYNDPHLKRLGDDLTNIDLSYDQAEDIKNGNNNKKVSLSKFKDSEFVVPDGLRITQLQFNDEKRLEEYINAEKHIGEIYYFASVIEFSLMPDIESKKKLFNILKKIIYLIIFHIKKYLKKNFNSKYYTFLFINFLYLFICLGNR